MLLQRSRGYLAGRRAIALCLLNDSADRVQHRRSLPSVPPRWPPAAGHTERLVSHITEANRARLGNPKICHNLCFVNGATFIDAEGVTPEMTHSESSSA